MSNRAEQVGQVSEDGDRDPIWTKAVLPKHNKHMILCTIFIYLRFYIKIMKYICLWSIRINTVTNIPILETYNRMEQI